MKRVALLAMALLMAFGSCACTASAVEPVRIQAATQEALSAYGTEPMPTPAHNDGSAPLSIIRGVESCGDGYIVYPKVLYCDYAEQINESIFSVTASRAEEVSASIFTKYRIEYNRNGIFSLRMELFDLYGESGSCLQDIYMTYDVEKGRLCSISDLFDSENERWRGVMPDIITAQAEAKGITLLCDVMPIADEQQFYITQDEVVLVYELYEIATWAAGEPEFAIPISQLSQFIPADSPLNKVGLDEARFLPDLSETDARDDSVPQEEFVAADGVMEERKENVAP